MSYGDRRRFPRETCLISASLRIGRQVIEGTIANIAERGAYLASTDAARLGSVGTLHFRNPRTGTETSTEVEIVRVVGPGSAEGPQVGLALRFACGLGELEQPDQTRETRETREPSDAAMLAAIDSALNATLSARTIKPTALDDGEHLPTDTDILEALNQALDSALGGDEGEDAVEPEELPGHDAMLAALDAALDESLGLDNLAIDDTADEAGGQTLLELRGLAAQLQDEDDQLSEAPTLGDIEPAHDEEEEEEEEEEQITDPPDLEGETGEAATVVEVAVDEQHDERRAWRMEIEARGRRSGDLQEERVTERRHRTPGVAVLFDGPDIRPGVGRLYDVSVEGMFISCAEQPPMGAKLRLRFQIPNEARSPIKVMGRCSWLVQAPAGDRPPGFGLKIAKFGDAMHKHRYGWFVKSLR